MPLDLSSPSWSRLADASGAATEVPTKIRAVQGARTEVEWEDAYDQLAVAVLLHGEAFSSTHAVMPYLLDLVKTYGFCDQSDRMLASIGCAARHDSMLSEELEEEVSEELEVEWEDTKDEAKALLLQRFFTRRAAREPDQLISSYLSLAGASDWSDLVDRWCFGDACCYCCRDCSNCEGATWDANRPVRTTKHGVAMATRRGDFQPCEDLPLEAESIEDCELETPDDVVSVSLGLIRLLNDEHVESMLRYCFGPTFCKQCTREVMLRYSWLDIAAG